MRILRVDLDQLAFDLSQTKLNKNVVVFYRRVFYLLQSAPNYRACFRDHRPVGFGDKMWAEIRTQGTSPEDELVALQTVVQNL